MLANPYQWTQLLTRTTSRRDYVFLSYIYIRIVEIRNSTIVYCTIVY